MMLAREEPSFETEERKVSCRERALREASEGVRNVFTR
jgi:hypothetical protein